MGVDLRAPYIYVLMPSHDMVPFNFAYDLSQLMLHTAASLPVDVKVGVAGATSTVVHKAREDLVKQVLPKKPTHLLWLDTDMRFPRETLIHMLARDVDVLGVNAVRRAVPTAYTAWETLSPPKHLETTFESTGLAEVEAMGMSVMLIKVSALVNMPDPYEVPWFDFERYEKDDGTMAWRGEDVVFCNHLREAGNTLYVDQDLSKHIGHTGLYEFDIGTMEGQRRAEKELEVQRKLLVEV